MYMDQIVSLIDDDFLLYFYVNFLRSSNSSIPKRSFVIAFFDSAFKVHTVHLVYMTFKSVFIYLSPTLFIC